jgi:16S rRNA (cytosine967-C5)-methyltransferase
MDNRGRIVAVDPQPARLDRVTDAAARLGVTIVQTIGGTVQDLVSSYASTADAVLVDVPCTNLGVLRRNPEVKWRRRPEDIAASAARQLEILTAAAMLAKSGGRLVYATCSPEPEENDAVVAAFLTAHPAWRLDPPAGFPLPLDGDGYLRTRPDRHGTDAFTAVRLRRA